MPVGGCVVGNSFANKIRVKKQRRDFVVTALTAGRKSCACHPGLTCDDKAHTTVKVLREARGRLVRCSCIAGGRW